MVDHVAFDRPTRLCSLLSTPGRMLITTTYHDVPSALDNGRPIRIFIIAPNVPGYSQAKFPGRSARTETLRSSLIHLDSKVLFVSLRSTRLLVQWSVSLVRLPATDTLLVGWSNGTPYSLEDGAIDLGSACPSTYHEFEGPEPIPYDTEGKPTTRYLAR